QSAAVSASVTQGRNSAAQRRSSRSSLMVGKNIGALEETPAPASMPEVNREFSLESQLDRLQNVFGRALQD
ncbi:unnamed protein product, partial [Amoebophrya sp. A120]